MCISQANASFGICLDISNDLFDASVDLTTKEGEGKAVGKDDETDVEVVPVSPVNVADPEIKEDDVRVKRVALVTKESPAERPGPFQAGAPTRMLSTTQKVLTSSSAFPSKVNPNPKANRRSLKNKSSQIRTVAPAVTTKVPPRLLERDLKKSASKVAEGPGKLEKPVKDGSGKKPNSGNKENVCKQLLNMSLKAKEVEEKKGENKKPLGTYKGLVVRNRTINAESEDDHPEDAVHSEVVVEKAFLVTRVTKKDNVAQPRNVTKGVLTKTSRPWKRV